MHNHYLTIERVVALKPCHAPEKIKAWYPGRKRVRLSTVLRDTRITRADRLWLATRVLPREVVVRWLTVVVERAVRRYVGRSGCQLWEEWAAAWLDGTDRTEASAWASCGPRAWAIVEGWWAADAWWAAASARAAAWAASAASEADAASAASAADAARWAAEEARAASAADAECEQQIADLLEIMAG